MNNIFNIGNFDKTQNNKWHKTSKDAFKWSSNDNDHLLSKCIMERNNTCITQYGFRV